MVSSGNRGSNRLRRPDFEEEVTCEYLNWMLRSKVLWFPRERCFQVKNSIYKRQKMQKGREWSELKAVLSERGSESAHASRWSWEAAAAGSSRPTFTVLWRSKLHLKDSRRGASGRMRGLGARENRIHTLPSLFTSLVTLKYCLASVSLSFHICKVGKTINARHSFYENWR